MSTDLEEAYEKSTGISEAHRLSLTDEKTTRKGGRDDDDFFFDEINESGEVVAKYHAWSHKETYPPFKADSGCEKVR